MEVNKPTYTWGAPSCPPSYSHDIPIFSQSPRTSGNGPATSAVSPTNAWRTWNKGCPGSPGMSIWNWRLNWFSFRFEDIDSSHLENSVLVWDPQKWWSLLVFSYWGMGLWTMTKKSYGMLTQTLGFHCNLTNIRRIPVVFKEGIWLCM